jgi:hypothetical protein
LRRFVPSNSGNLFDMIGSANKFLSKTHAANWSGCSTNRLGLNQKDKMSAPS